MIPENVLTILKTLNSAGYEAYIVGGAVRDYIMGKEPHDYDITTNATPEETKAVFGHTIDTGIKHGTVTALIDGEGYEITTYRVDGTYTDGRHPDSVTFTKDIRNDLARRDLTINAIAMDADGAIVDPFGGRQDIADKVIRCVGRAEDRFREDALRMLRAIRFEGQHGFSIEVDTMAAIINNAGLIDKVSPERKREELTKLLMSDNPKKAFRTMFSTGLMDVILPEFSKCMDCEHESPYHYASVGIHILDVVEHVPKDPNLRWSALLHDIGKPDTKTKNDKEYCNYLGHAEHSRDIAVNILNRLKFSNANKKEILELVGCHDLSHSKNSKVRSFAATHTRPFIEKLSALKYADAYCHADKYRDELIAKSRGFIEQALSYIDDGTAIQKEDLKLNGNDLQDLGLKGKEIGDCLNMLYEMCIRQPELNKREKLIRQAIKYCKEHDQAIQTEIDTDTR